MKSIYKLKTAVSAVFFIISSSSIAAEFTVPSANRSLIGETIQSTITTGDRSTTITQKYDIGFNALESANPQLNLSQPLPTGTYLQVPTQHLLPNLERNGIVINLPEMRMYYYVQGTNKVLTYPIGIGKIGKTIPITRTAITRKKKDPVWIPTKNIREFNLEQGIVLPSIMPAGPDNPLGQYAIYMKVPTYLMHSSPFTESIGKRASFGCIRMYENDIQTFFPLIESGIPVAIVNSPVKVGFEDERLYLEAYKPLEEHSTEFEGTLPGMVHMITAKTGNQPVLIDWQQVSFIEHERDGVPHNIGMIIPRT